MDANHRGHLTQPPPTKITLQRRKGDILSTRVAMQERTQLVAGWLLITRFELTEVNETLSLNAEGKEVNERRRDRIVRLGQFWGSVESHVGQERGWTRDGDGPPHTPTVRIQITHRSGAQAESPTHTKAMMIIESRERNK